MYVLALTIFLGLVMASLFVFLFVREHGQGRERDALLPFDEEGVRPARAGGPGNTHSAPKP
jgi:hypothetical protein